MGSFKMIEISMEWYNVMVNFPSYLPLQGPPHLPSHKYLQLVIYSLDMAEDFDLWVPLDPIPPAASTFHMKGSPNEQNGLSFIFLVLSSS